MDLRYRFEQFRQLITAQSLPIGAWKEIESVLDSDELALFRRYSKADRQHSYRVMRTLRDGGYGQPQLLAAALLHDVGKTCYRLRLWERVIGALVEVLCTKCVEKWGVGEPAGWRRPFAIRQQHAEWGAELAMAASSDSLTVTLIRYHQHKSEPLTDAATNQLLKALQWADDQN